MCVSSSSAESTALSWHEWRGLENCLPGRSHFKLLYAASAWLGITRAADRQRTDAFICRGLGAEFCDEYIPAMSHHVKDADDALFERAVRDKHHVLYHLFPDRKTGLSTIWGNVVVNLLWLKKIGHLADCNFITRLYYFTKTVIDTTRM